MRRPIGIALALLALSCGGVGASVLHPSGGATFTGRVTYDARQPTPQGASEAVTARPARFVELALLDARGETVSEGTTGPDGTFALEGPPDAARLRVYARVRARGHDLAIARDEGGRETHAVDVPLEGPAEEIVLHNDDASGDGGAFHVLDTLLRGLDAVKEWTGRQLPPLYSYWVRGGTREWSFYRGERPEGSGRFALELLGGDPGQASVTDTDEHDEAIILHELGHFVMDRLSGDSSTGGMHPTGVRIDPGLAWEEGRATWFALAVLGAPIYQDTIGVQPWGSLRVDEDLESTGGQDALVGLASETSVSRILWDLTDGGEGPPDQDDDGMALGAPAILEAMIAQAQQPGAFPSLPTFLLHLIEQGAVSREALSAMLTATGQPVDELLPAPGASVWPPDVAPGTTLSGRIDGHSQPSPAGGINLPRTGFSAIHTYRVHVDRGGMLVLRLAIQGSGQGADHTDLDLELLDLRADRIADSRAEVPTEAIQHLVQPGWYIVRVRDGGSGNAADYTLALELETL